MPAKIEELKADIAELRKLLEVATRPRVRDALIIDLRKMETTLSTLKETVDQQACAATTSKSSNSPKQIPTEKMRDYAWDQSDKFVKFYLTVPGVHDLDANLISFNTTETSVSLTVSAPDKIRVFSVEDLLNDIVPEESSHKVKTDSVVVLLKKKQADKWSCITKTEKKIKDRRDAAYRPSDEKMDSGNASGALMDLMKKMYVNGDDEMKRTIAKCWTESQNKEKISPMDL